MGGNHRRRSVLVLCLVIGVVFGAHPAGASARPRHWPFRQHRVRVTHGLTLVKITNRRGRVRAKALVVDPHSHLSMGVALARKRFPGTAPVSVMARRHRALAAVNGDFFVPRRQPAGPLVKDGWPVQASRAFEPSFAVSFDRRHAYARYAQLRIEGVQLRTGTQFNVHLWNYRRPGPGEIAAYSPQGGSVASPPPRACSARLRPIGPKMWTSDRAWVQRAFRVRRSRCRGRPMERFGGVVLSTPWGSTRSDRVIRGMRRGDVVRMQWSMNRPGILDSLGGYPELLSDGHVVAPRRCWSLCGRNPRTGIGVKPNGQIVMMTVDGRYRRWSRGVTLRVFAQLFRWLGAQWAMNLDGGGSSTMVVRGRVINRPSEGRERPVATALMVLRRRHPRVLPISQQQLR